MSLNVDVPHSPLLTGGPSPVSLSLQLRLPRSGSGSGVELQLRHAGVNLSVSVRPELSTAGLPHQRLPPLSLGALGVNTEVAGAAGGGRTARPGGGREGRVVTRGSYRAARVKAGVNTKVLQGPSASEVAPSSDWRTVGPRILTDTASWFV